MVPTSGSRVEVLLLTSVLAMLTSIGRLVSEAACRFGRSVAPVESLVITRAGHFSAWPAAGPCAGTFAPVS